VVINSVPTGATVVGIPGRAVADRREPISDLEHGKLPDPISDAIRRILEQQNRLEQRIRELESVTGLEVAANKSKEEIEDEDN
jgi:serine O-acetyltransferase